MSHGRPRRELKMLFYYYSLHHFTSMCFSRMFWVNRLDIVESEKSLPNIMSRSSHTLEHFGPKTGFFRIQKSSSFTIFFLVLPEWTNEKNNQQNEARTVLWILNASPHQHIADPNNIKPESFAIFPTVFIVELFSDIEIAKICSKMKFIIAFVVVLASVCVNVGYSMSLL